MNKKTSIETRNRVFEYWLKGTSRNQIAKKLGISQGNVSSIINSWPSTLKPLRDLAKSLKKHNILPIEAKQGVEVLNQLKKVGVKLEQTKYFIESAQHLSKQKGYQPHQVIQAAIKISELEATSNKTYPQIIKHQEKLIQQNQKLKEQNKQLKLSFKENNQKVKDSIKAANTTKKQIQYQQKLIENLKKIGLTFEDLDLVWDFVQNIKNSQGNPKKFVNLTIKHKSIARQIEQKQRQLQTVKKDLKEEKNNLNQFIKDSASQRVQVGKQTKEILERKKILELSLQNKQDKTQHAKNKLEDLNNSITQKQAKNDKLKQETAEILSIKNYAKQKQQAIIKLQNEIENKKTWIEVADLFKNLFANAQEADFKALKYFVNQIEKQRYQTTQQPTPTNVIQIKNLKDFIKNYLANKIQTSLIKENKKLEKENQQLKNQLNSQTNSNQKI